MALHAFQRLGYRLFGRLARRRAQENPRLSMALVRAHIAVRPDVYLAAAYLAAASILAVALVPGIAVFAIEAAGLTTLPPRTFLVLLGAPLLLALSTHLTLLVLPDIKASRRARDINQKLPYALNYIATMSSAGATPHKVFSALSANHQYGEVSNEAAWIVRDLDLLGVDLVTALNRASERTPSIKLQDVLQGAVTALTSGGDLKSYFLQKSEQFLYENRQEQEKTLESLAVLAESFVTVVVAAPLFLIVLLSVMTSFGSSATEVLTLGYLIVLVLLPISQAGFALTIKHMSPEA